MADRDPSAKGQFGGRCPGPGVDDYLAADSRPVTEGVLKDSWEPLSNAPVSADRYTSAEFFALEKQHVWPHVWQFAAREDELLEPGDTVVYENMGKSYLLVRQQDHSVRAFVNVCLHRGRKLRDESGPAKEFQCPFHGFTWKTDGSLKEIPCAWDFEHLKSKDMSLPEVRVGQWAGYIFINEDSNAMSLKAFLHPLPEIFPHWRMEECYTAMWVGKVIDANWKVCAEAFMEAWHSVVTHPQILPFTGDANTRYSIWGDHANLALTPFGVLSPHLYDKGHDEQYIVDTFMTGSSRMSDEKVVVPPGKTARQVMAEANRKMFLTDLGYDPSVATDSDMLDAYTYNVFPNFSPWGGFMPTIVYRWRPWPNHEHTLMEVRLLARKPKDAPMPAATPMTMLGPDQPWTAYEPWGSLGQVYDQDMANLPYVHEGLKASANNAVELGNYQESRIRQFHNTIDKYIARGKAGAKASG